MWPRYSEELNGPTMHSANQAAVSVHTSMPVSFFQKKNCDDNAKFA